MRAYDWSAECPVQKMATGGYYVRNDDCPGLLCVTCKEPFGKRRSPRILPCSHVFCLQCLIALEASAVAIKTAFSPSADCQQTDSDNDKSLSIDGTKVTDDDIAGSSGVFLCPTCRTCVSVPEGGVGYFPYNIYLNCGIPGDDSPLQTGNPLVVAQKQHQGAVSSLRHFGATKTLSVAELANKLDLLENHVTQNRVEMAQIKTDLKETEAVVAETKKDLEKTEADVTQNKTDVAQVKTDLKKTETDVAQNKTDMALIKTDLKETETGVAQNKADVTQTDVTQNKTDVAQIKTDLKKTETDVAQNKTDMAQIKTDLKKTETGVAQNKADVTQTDVTQNKTDVAQIKPDLKKTETDVAQNKTDWAQIKTDLKKAETGVAQNKADVARLKIDLRKTRAIVNAANIQMNEHADKLAKAGMLVSFNAWVMDTVKTKENQPIVFNYVTENEGGCYNQTTGVFTAPVNGTYVFGASVAKKDGESGYVEAVLKVDDIEFTFFSGSSTSQGSNSLSIGLDEGDRVWVESRDKSDDYDDCGYMSFTGALVQPEL